MIEKVGLFTFDTESQQLLGPEGFLQSQDYAAWKERFIAGQDTWFNFAVRGVQPGLAVQFEVPTGRGSEPAVAMLVSLQTAYAGWAGREDLLSSFKKEAS
jgi:hypothetical protein